MHKIQSYKFLRRFTLVILLSFIVCSSGQMGIAMEIQSSFQDLGNNKFRFTTKRGVKEVRSLIEYQTFKSQDQSPALVVGGGHLTPEEAYNLSKEYARSGQGDYMFQGVDNRHIGHTVINIDPKTKPDFECDFTEDGLIVKLGLLAKFSRVILEHLPPSFNLNPNVLANAWNALIPGGTLTIFPSQPREVWEILASAGRFRILKYYSGKVGDEFVDTLRTNPDTFLTIPAITLEKVTQSGQVPLRIPQNAPSAPQQKGEGAIVKAAKIGRNDSCPCKSGKKYKRCCGNSSN